MDKFKTRVALRQNGSFMSAIPKEVIKQLKINKVDTLEYVIHMNGSVTIKKA